MVSDQIIRKNKDKIHDLEQNLTSVHKEIREKVSL